MSEQLGDYVETGGNGNGPTFLQEAKTDPLRSPLHRLQTEIAKDNKYTMELSPTGDSFRIKDIRPSTDNESIYSFDSVSTSGRLLDRLDLDPDEYTDEDLLRRRESTYLIQSTGRLLDRLQLEDSTPEYPAIPHPPQHLNSKSSTQTLVGLGTKYTPIRGNSTLGIERLKSANKIPVRTNSSSSQPLKSASGAIVRQPANSSFDSLHGEISLASPTSGFSLASLETDLYGTVTKSSSSFSINTRSDSTSPFNSQQSISLLTKSGVNPKFQKLRSLSDNSITSSNSVSSADGAQFIFNPTPFFDPQVEINLKKAISLRLEGNHREASYQLQLLANIPINYPKAMYLYAQALNIGQGVKLNQLQSARWLCRCILVCYMLEYTPSSDLSAVNNYVTKLADISPEQLIAVIVRNISKEKNDPSQLIEQFKGLSQVTITKVANLNSKDNNIPGSAYYALGNCLLLGQGFSKDEEKARLLFAKSASVGYADAMVTLGELWASKSKHFRKDLCLAAAWLRLGELFGKQDMGNSWIYKDKYMEKRKSEDEKKSSKDRKRF